MNLCKFGIKKYFVNCTLKKNEHEKNIFWSVFTGMYFNLK